MELYCLTKRPSDIAGVFLERFILVERFVGSGVGFHVTDVPSASAMPPAEIKLRSVSQSSSAQGTAGDDA
jgi:hypothetical protein